MNIRDKYYCKRTALGMSQKEFAAIGGVDEGIVSLFEKGEYVPPYEVEKLTYNVENYIHHLDRNRYLTTRIIEETMNLRLEPENEHQHTLSHLMIHVAKLNMEYAG